jgi:hypothetical protein
MVNNMNKRAQLLRPFFLFLLGIFILLPTQAQRISKYYNSSIQENGLLYFIEPPQEFVSSDGESSLLFDITYLTTDDSATLNFTFIDAAIQKIDSIHFHQPSSHLGSPARKIFVESYKGIWKHRYSASFSFEELNAFFTQIEEIGASLTFEKGKIELQPAKRKWEKHALILSRVLAMIEANSEDP